MLHSVPTVYKALIYSLTRSHTLSRFASGRPVRTYNLDVYPQPTHLNAFRNVGHPVCAATCATL